ncbi:alpha-1-3-mannosyl-glyco 4-beta-N-acetylglucosaminyltransferase MGAT4D isoform X1 [Brachionus plicatilis]|uniref:Alpha-1-3-mannosyl-glyco 4-beta-N-acetylglucosaminyltransferase MGAT4D isoform X1 n=1 Tax=Brachionus plicatilis TaxID=10195 RepID=A0A3M7QYN1_BRAPC|nr:alpha-1-3-mannosyl-glyco 4-beta-N-acetylglucosaminyltransferase MGAT4D isoform X1 [Brachionus plicatilis]
MVLAANMTPKNLSQTEMTIHHTSKESKLESFTRKKIRFKSVIETLPHTNEESNYDPDLEISGNRNASLVIGISTIKREKTYLFETLNSIFSAIDYDKDLTNQVLIILSIAEIEDSQFVNETVERILTNYKKNVDSGLLDIIQPAKIFYPSFNEAVKRDYVFNDSAQRIRWRKKQNYDVSYLMNYAKERGIYYLQLEDDILCQYNFVSEIFKFVQKSNNDLDSRWKMIEFSPLGFIGKLFRTKDLTIFINMFLWFSDYKPLDLIHNYVFDIIACDPSKNIKLCKPNLQKVKIVYKPSLFQHVGLQSSLKGKIQKLKDKKFVHKIPIKKHLNPDATLSTSFKFYQGHTFSKLYFGIDYCWINEGAGRDNITINFKEKFLLKGYVIKSGASLHPDDKIPINSSLEIRLSDKINHEELKSKNLFPTKDDYFEVDRIQNDSGEMVRNLNQTLWFNINSLRLRVPNFTADKWILIYEFGIF